MGEYNKEELKKLLDRRDLLGAADYLSSLKAETPQKQYELNQKIDALRREGEIQYSMTQKMNFNQKEAFHFVNGIKGAGTIPHSQYDGQGTIIDGTSNSYGDKYLDYINNIQSEFGTPIKYVYAVFDNDESLNKMYNIVGDSTYLKKQYGVNITKDSSTGKTTMQLNLHNKRFPEIMTMLDDNEYDHTVSFGKNFNGLMLPPRRMYNLQYGSDDKMFTEDQLDNNKHLRQYDNTTSRGALRAALDTYREAFKTQEEAFNVLGNRAVEEEMYVTPFLGHGHANAYKRMTNGFISIDDYKKIVEERTNVYNTLIKQHGFSGNRVYAVNLTTAGYKNNEVLRELTSSKDKSEILRMMLVAMDDKRLTYSAAMHGGEIGTYITISPEKDKDGNYSSGNAEQGYRIFVPGLFKSSEDESFANDTKTKAARDYADMQHWNFGKRLQDGTYIGHSAEDGDYMLVNADNGEQVRVPISEENMLQLLNQNHIINNSVAALISALDEKGNPIMVQNKDGESVPFDIDSSADKLATAAVNELYPEARYTKGDRLYFQNSIYKRILEILEETYNYNNSNNQ